MVPVPSPVARLSIAQDATDGSWTISCADPLQEHRLRPWLWGERRRLVQAASRDGYFDGSRFVAGVAGTLYDPPPPPELSRSMRISRSTCLGLAAARADAARRRRNAARRSVLLASNHHRRTTRGGAQFAVGEPHAGPGGRCGMEQHQNRGSGRWLISSPNKPGCARRSTGCCALRPAGSIPRCRPPRTRIWPASSPSARRMRGHRSHRPSAQLTPTTPQT